MRPGSFKRRVAAIILFSFSCLSLLSIAAVLNGARIDEAMRRGTMLFAADRTATIGPIRVSVTPDVILTSAQAKFVASPDGPVRTIELTDPRVTVAFATGSDAADEQQNALTSAMAEASTIKIRNGSIGFHTGGASSPTMSEVDAELTLKGGRIASARGQGNYLGQIVKFDISGLGRSSDGDQQRSRVAWTARVFLTSPVLEVMAEGRLEQSDLWSFTAETEAKTPDAAKLAAWLTQSWSGAATGPALLIKGPMTWSNGVIAFGKSRVSVGDQNGVGAASLSIRENRPLIEATLAFPALDVTPLLYTKPSQLELNESPQSTWRCLATHFPAVRSLDADLRLSIGRMQWRGAPVGKAAFSVSSRGGVIHADFSELDLGLYTGNLQIAIDERTPNMPVVLRGRFQSNNAAPLSEQIVGSPIMTGAAAGQFEITGLGETLGDLVDRASGRGAIDARDGQLHLSLAAAQKLMRSGARIATTGWGAIAGSTPYQSLTARLQMRDGSMQIEEATLRSGTYTAFARGRVSFAQPDLDLRLRLEPGRADVIGAAAPEGRAASADAIARQPLTGTGSLSIVGSWPSPVLKVVPDGPVP